MVFNPNSTGSDQQHINTAVAVAKDDEGRIWLYFGTGRYWSEIDRTEPYFSYQQSFYGIKEPIEDVDNCDPSDPDDPDCALSYGTVGAKASNLKNTTGIEVYNYDTITGGVSPVADQDGDGTVDFSDLEAEVKNKHGWYLNFSEIGERNLGQAAVLGDLVTFSTFVPDSDLCASEGMSYLYGLYYKTGTAYWKGVLLTEENNWTGKDASTMVIPKIQAGRGYSTTPNIHTGREEGSKAFIQTSTGAIIAIEQANPGITKSGKVSWQERTP